MVDTLYVHALDGTLHSKLPLGGTGAAALRFPMPEAPEDMSLREWLSSRPFVSRAFWWDDETIVSEVLEWVEGDTREPSFSLVFQNTKGEPGLLVEGTPRLHAVSGEEGLFFFSNPDHLEPNQVMVMRRGPRQ